MGGVDARRSSGREFGNGNGYGYGNECGWAGASPQILAPSPWVEKAAA